MTQLYNHLADTREIVTKLLDELQLEAYLFEIEPEEEQWIFTIECAIDEGWGTVKLKAKKDYFLHGADDAVFHQLFLDDWREALSACKVKAS